MSILDPKITLFLDYLQQERQFSPHTISSYKMDLLEAQRFFSELAPLSWENVSENSIRSLLSSKRNKGISPRSLNRQLSALKAFFKFLLQRKFISENKIATITTLKTKKSLPKPLEVDQMFKLLDHSSSNPMDIRDLAIMELLYSSGIRVSELVALNLQDIDLNQQQITVLGKSKKMRLALLGTFAIKALNLWLANRATLAPPQETALFINKNGTRLTPRGIQFRLKQIGLSQEITTNITPHRFRHSFASHLLESSNDLRCVQELLGHANLSTTEIYTKINFQHLANSYDQCHPRARKNKKEHQR